MPFWVAAAGAVVGGISSYFGQRSQAKAQKKEQQQQFAIDKYFIDLQRQDALKKQAYKEHTIAAYRGFGTPGLISPGFTDPNSIMPVDPYTKQPVRAEDSASASQYGDSGALTNYGQSGSGATGNASQAAAPTAGTKHGDSTLQKVHKQVRKVVDPLGLFG